MNNPFKGGEKSRITLATRSSTERRVRQRFLKKYLMETFTLNMSFKHIILMTTWRPRQQSGLFYCSYVVGSFEATSALLDRQPILKSSQLRLIREGCQKKTEKLCPFAKLSPINGSFSKKIMGQFFLGGRVRGGFGKRAQFFRFFFFSAPFSYYHKSVCSQKYLFFWAQKCLTKL